MVPGRAASMPIYRRSFVVAVPPRSLRLPVAWYATLVILLFAMALLIRHGQRPPESPPQAAPSPSVSPASESYLPALIPLDPVDPDSLSTVAGAGTESAATDGSGEPASSAATEGQAPPLIDDAAAEAAAPEATSLAVPD